MVDSLIERTRRYRGFEILDVVLVAIFTVEMLLKIFAYGLICGKASYLRSGWNILDGLVVVICILDYAVAMAGSTAERLRLPSILLLTVEDYDRYFAGLLFPQ